ncbi:MAG: pyruvate formate lyase 1-activating protein, partial [Candidatus Kapaibacterium sp.]
HDNQVILNHITKLNRNRADMLLRYVIIPGLTDTRSELAKLADFIINLPYRVPLELLAYHTMGVKKWQELGLPYELRDYPKAEKSDLEQAKSYLLAYGLKSTQVLY